MEMQAKNVLYAAVGAPVVAARKVSDQVSALKEKIEEEKANYGKVTEKTLDAWAAEGEKILARLKEGKVVEKMDLDQAKEQVGKLRDQLEEMLDTWRQSFRPEKAEVKTAKPAAKSTAPKKPAAKSTAPKKPAAKSTAPKKPAAKKQTSAAKTTKSSTAAKTSSARSSTPKGAKAS